MANIIGRGFENYVTEQINTRQKKLNKSSDNYQEGVLQYTTNKTSWIRLSSGVNVDASKTQELGLSGQESSILAQNNIISTGIVNSNLSLNYTANVNYGYTPPVGIKSVDVKSLNKGSLREANIQITCHNLYQFNIIETLYLRLGYSILLEWGHTMWFDNKTQEINNVVDNSVLNSFLYSKPPATKESLLNLINETKIKSCGNYDAFFGVVVNFEWKLRNDGGYDISIRAKSVGDIIESLKLNSNITTAQQNVQIQAQQGRENIQIIADANKSTLNFIIMMIRFLIDAKTNSGLSSLVNDITNEEISRSTSFKFLNTGKTGSFVPFATTPVYKGEYDGYKANFKNLNDGDPSQYYISLGTLLRIIECFLSVDDGNSKPLFYIDYDFTSNLCFTFSNQVSTDPNVCLVPRGYNLVGATGILSNISMVYKTSNEFIGRIMDIFVNLNYINLTLNNNIKNGKLPIYDFLKNLMNGIQTSLGNINNFEVIYEHETNTFNIIDSTYIPGVFEYLKKPDPIIAKFTPSILTSKEGSFLTNLSIESKLDNKFTAMITIGAQVNNSIVNENLSPLGKWNNGLTDRIIPKKLDINAPLNTSDIPIGFNPGPDSKGGWIQNYITYVMKIDDGSITLEDVGNFKQGVVDFLKDELNEFIKNDNISGVGFIPISLNITMDGLSGIRIYEVYTINDILLPLNYQNNVQFTCVGVTHKIDENGWTTTLESISGPKPKKTKTPPKPLSSNTTTVNTTENTTSPSGITVAGSIVVGGRKGGQYYIGRGLYYSLTKTPSDKRSTGKPGESTWTTKLIEETKKLGYFTNKSLYEGEDIIEETYTKGIAFLRAIKNNYTNLKLTITSANRGGPPQHGTGWALDIDILSYNNKSIPTWGKNITQQEQQQLIQDLCNLAVSVGWDVAIDEYNYPTKRATGGHIHLQLKQKGK